jgi:hypothetical protein
MEGDLHGCDRCGAFGLSYCRRYSPEDYVEGRLDSRIWIVGLHPKGEPGWNDPRDAQELSRCFEGRVHPYFRDFERVSPLLYSLLGRDGGAAHVNVVKCYTNRFPPRSLGIAAAEQIVRNCRPYLAAQLRTYCPQVIVCNGAPVCEVISEVIPPVDHRGTSYAGRFEGREVTVILSAFMGRLDNYSKLRLGQEIGSQLEHLGLTAGGRGSSVERSARALPELFTHARQLED